MKGLLAGLKIEMFEPLMSKGLPTPDDLTAVDKLAADIQARHADLDQADRDSLRPGA